MSSTNKSEKLNLNQWVGSDIPCREDFNNDNAIIDGVLGSHINNAHIHITSQERNLWNSLVNITTYYGDGASTRNIFLPCTFSPKMVIVFASSYPPSIVDVENEANYNYFGIATTSGSMTGLSVAGKTLTVTQSSVAVSGSEFRNFNEQGVTYIAVMIR